MQLQVTVHSRPAEEHLSSTLLQSDAAVHTMSNIKYTGNSSKGREARFDKRDRANYEEVLGDQTGNSQYKHI